MNLQPKNKIFFNEDLHQYTDEVGKIYPSVTEILKFFGVINIHYSNENSRNFGIVLHKTLELLDTDNLKEHDPALKKWLGNYLQFKQDYKPDYSLIEQPLISKIWGFAGIPDRVWQDNLLDIKSGQKEDWHFLQASAYAVLVEENYSIKIKKQYGLYLKEDKYQLLPVENKKHIFLGAVNLYNFMKGK